MSQGRRMRAGIARWAAVATREAVAGLRRGTPLGVAAVLAGAAFAPVVLALPVPAAVGAAGLQFAAGLGGNYVAALLREWTLRLKAGDLPLTEAELSAALAAELRNAMSEQSAAGAGLRAEVAHLLGEVEAVEAAVTGLQEDVAQLVAEMLAVLVTVSEFQVLATGLRDVLERLEQRSIEEDARRAQEMEEFRRATVTLGLAAREVSMVARALDSGTAADAAVPPDVSSPVSPYPGLAPFQSSDAHVFFGRNRLTVRLLQRITVRDAGPAVLPVIGPSGVGKSSLLRAGLIPEIYRQQPWPVMLMTPGADPFTALAVRLADLAGVPAGPILDDLRADPGRARLIAAQAVVHARTTDRLVLVVDQFEELFTQGDESGRTAFIRAVRAMAEPPDPPVTVVLGLRADFYGHCLARPDLFGLVSGRGVDVGPLDDRELTEAIEGPARYARLTLQPGLRETVVEDLRKRKQGTDAEAGDGSYDPGALPLLAHTLRETWALRENGRLTMAGYRKAGGIDGSVRNTADSCYDAFDRTARDLVRRVMLRLVTVTDVAVTRRRRALTDLADEVGGAGRVLPALIDARLLTTDKGQVEITHESLLWAWPQLQAWVNEDRTWIAMHREISDALTDRERYGTLLTGVQLDAVEERLRMPFRFAELSAREQELVRDSRRGRDEEIAASIRRTRWRRAAVSAVTVLAVLAASGAVIALQQRGEAVDQRRQATSRQIATQADLLAAAQPRESILLAAAAWRTWPTPTARGSLLATQRQAYAGTFEPQRQVIALAYAPDGTLAAGGADGSVQLTTGTRFAAHPSGVRAMAFSPDGGRLLTAGDERTARLWDVATGRQVTTFEEAAPVNGVAFASDGTTVATTSRTHVSLWDTSTGAKRATLNGGGLALDAVVFGPGGRTVAAGSVDRRIRLWQVGDRSAPSVFDAGAAVSSLAFSPDGRTLLAGTDAGALAWPAAEPGRPRWQSRDPFEKVTAVGFRAGGEQFATAGSGRGIRVVDAATGRERATLTGHTREVNALAFAPTGNRLATAGADGGVLLWNLDHLPRPVPGTGVPSPDGAMLATAGTDGRIAFAAAGDPTRTLATSAPLTGLPTGPVWAGGLLAAADGAGVLHLIDPATGSDTGGFRQQTGVPATIAADRAGRLLALSDSYSHQVALWDIAARRQIGTLPGDGEPVTALAFSADGHRLAGGGTGRAVTVWDTSTLRAVHTMTGTAGGITAAAFDPSGRTLATAEPGTVRLWDTGDGALVAALSTGGATTSALAFPASGRLRTVTDSAVMEWDLDPDQVLTTICSGPIGTLTVPEWQRYTGTTEVTASCP